MLKHLISRAAILAVMLSVGAACQASDDGEQNSQDLAIKITAPIEAFDLVSTPRTITVLGTTIQLAADAVIERGDDGDEGGDGEDGDNKKSAVVLTVGKYVEITLKSNDAPLTASKVDVTGSDDGIQIKGTVQAVDATAQTLTILGLTVSAANALISGENGDSAIILAAGQLVEVNLDPLAYPASLNATEITIENNATGIEIEIDEPDGDNNNHDDGGDDEVDGNNNDVTEVDVVELVQVKSSPKARKAKATHKVHVTGSGKSLKISGLLPGKAKITIHRHGKTVTKTVTVKRDTHKKVHVRIH